MKIKVLVPAIVAQVIGLVALMTLVVAWIFWGFDAPLLITIAVALIAVGSGWMMSKQGGGE